MTTEQVKDPQMCAQSKFLSQFSPTSCVAGEINLDAGSSIKAHDATMHAVQTPDGVTIDELLDTLEKASPEGAEAPRGSRLVFGKATELFVGSSFFWVFDSELKTITLRHQKE